MELKHFQTYRPTSFKKGLLSTIQNLYCISRTTVGNWEEALELGMWHNMIVMYYSEKYKQNSLSIILQVI